MIQERTGEGNLDLSRIREIERGVIKKRWILLYQRVTGSVVNATIGTLKEGISAINAVRKSQAMIRFIQSRRVIPKRVVMVVGKESVWPKRLRTIKRVINRRKGIGNVNSVKTSTTLGVKSISLFIKIYRCNRCSNKRPNWCGLSLCYLYNLNFFFLINFLIKKSPGYIFNTDFFINLIIKFMILKKPLYYFLC